MLNNLINMAMSGMLNQNPLMQLFNQNMLGKSEPDKMQTLINMAQAKGFDINKPIISKQEFESLKQFSRNFKR